MYKTFLRFFIVSILSCNTAFAVSFNSRTRTERKLIDTKDAVCLASLGQKQCNYSIGEYEKCYIQYSYYKMNDDQSNYILTNSEAYSGTVALDPGENKFLIFSTSLFFGMGLIGATQQAKLNLAGEEIVLMKDISNTVKTLPFCDNYSGPTLEQIRDESLKVCRAEFCGY